MQVQVLVEEQGQGEEQDGGQGLGQVIQSLALRAVAKWRDQPVAMETVKTLVDLKNTVMSESLIILTEINMLPLFQVNWLRPQCRHHLYNEHHMCMICCKYFGCCASNDFPANKGITIATEIWLVFVFSSVSTYRGCAPSALVPCNVWLAIGTVSSAFTYTKDAPLVQRPLCNVRLALHWF